MGRLIKEALYSHEEHDMHLGEMVEKAQLTGDTHKLHYLAETFGARPVNWDKVVENIKREDPHGIKSILLLRMMEVERGSKEYKRLEKLNNRYTKLTPEQRAADRVAGDFFCLAVHGKSIFDYKKGKSPWDA